MFYGTDMCGPLKADLESEYAAIRNYSKHIKMIADSDVKATLQRIILDEQVHAELFKRVIRENCV